LVYAVGNSNTSTNIVALTSSSGNPSWVGVENVGSYQSPVFANNRIYIDGQYDFFVYDAASGKLIKKMGLGNPSTGDASFCIMDDGVVYYPTESGMKN